MKRNKKTVMALSFCIGVALFGTTVFADISAKTGYDEFKAAVKNSFHSYSESVKNFTMEASMTAKDNGKVLGSYSGTAKYDNVSMRSEESSYSQNANGTEASTYSYRDQNGTVYYNQSNDVYYVNEYTQPNTRPVLTDPFKEERAADMEKIADALVGNLKDYIVVDDKADGTMELSGSLSETQIPALVNAISSFLFKQTFSERTSPSNDIQFPQLKDDIFIKNATGKAVTNKDGLVENLLASGILSGKDKDGNVHELSIEVLVKFTDIGSTIFEKPDLSSKKVEKSTLEIRDSKVVPQKFVGKYKNDIIIEKDDNFVKVGERYIEIAHIDAGNISGKYYEVYKDEYKEQYADKATGFNFDAEIQDGYRATFEYKGNGFDLSEIYLDSYGARVNLGGSAPDRFDYTFSRVFDN